MSHRNKSAQASDARQRLHLTGFTLVEALVVISIIALLLAVLVPNLSTARELMLQAKCKSNIKQLRQTMQSVPGTGGPNNMPAPGAWVDYIFSKGAQGVLICPKDTDTQVAQGTKLRDYYLVQNGNTFSYLSDIFDAADGQLSSFDSQMWRYKDGQSAGKFGEGPNNWPELSWGGPISPPSWATGFDNDAGIVVGQSGGATRIYSLDAPGDGGKTPVDMKSHGLGSDHWVCKGEGGRNGGRNWEKEIVMQLTGKSHPDIVDPPVEVTSGSASYGMNSLVEGMRFRSEQILLLEYEIIVAKVDPSGGHIDDFNSVEKGFAPRHFNRANVLLVDGSIREWTRDQVDPDLAGNFVNKWK